MRTTPKDIINCVVMDLDGCIANNDRRIIHAPDWDKVYEDMGYDPLYPDMAYLWTRIQREVPIFIFTGRPEKMRKVTEDWLKYHQLEYAKIMMRPDKNIEPNSKLKAEWADWVMEQGVSISMAYDDNPKAAWAYSNLLIPCHLVVRHNHNLEYLERL